MNAAYTRRTGLQPVRVAGPRSPVPTFVVRSWPAPGALAADPTTSNPGRRAPPPVGVGVVRGQDTTLMTQRGSVSVAVSSLRTVCFGPFFGARFCLDHLR